FYDQIIYAIGAQADRRMGIQGEDLPNSYAATAFVGWYNGHPDYRELPIDLSCERAVVVGNGNVAMDVTRILVTPPDELARTDIADHALPVLRRSKIREVVMLGRRGPAQASFTNPELREFGKLDGVDVVVDPQDLQLDHASVEALQSDRTAATNMEILREYATRTERTAPRRIVMRFFASPTEIIGESGKIAAVKIERNRLEVDANGGLRSRGTGQFETIPAGLVLRSIGYRCVPIEGVPFNEENHTVSNIAGRVVHPNTSEPAIGEYVVGWAKRGPSGLIGNNKPDSIATVNAMIEDLPSLPGIADDQRDLSRIEAFLHERHVDFVSTPDWQRLDRFEVAQGVPHGRPRVKVTTVPEMMAVIREPAGG
ncbi:MAG TPA: NADP oxidoreductase, partial [Ktedonobacterales bacterium]|nr:NADP oxidoreductase [Ktedonobacterales bacterium]